MYNSAFTRLLGLQFIACSGCLKKSGTCINYIRPEIRKRVGVGVKKV